MEGELDLRLQYCRRHEGLGAALGESVAQAHPFSVVACAGCWTLGGGFAGWQRTGQV